MLLSAMYNMMSSGDGVVESHFVDKALTFPQESDECGDLVLLF